MASRTSYGVADGVGARRRVELLPEELAGTIATRTAGAVEFRATLAWPEDIPAEPTLLEVPKSARCSLAQTEDPEAATRCFAGEIRAFTTVDLGVALEAILRTVTETAALTEAMLEIEAARTVPPRSPSSQALQALARDLWAAGFSVRFKPSWTPAPEAEIYLGIGDDGGALEEFLRAHPTWSVA